jgi:phosphoribosylformylglycinamidine cyclo-ligase
VPPVFQWLQHTGQVPEDDMRRAFNMGVGMIIVCAAGDAGAVMETLRAEAPVSIGVIEQGAGGVIYA